MKYIILIVSILICSSCISTPFIPFPEGFPDSRLYFDVKNTLGVYTSFIYINDDVIVDFFDRWSGGNYKRIVRKYIKDNHIDIYNDALIFIHINMPIESFVYIDNPQNGSISCFIKKNIEKKRLSQLKDSLSFYRDEEILKIMDPLYVFRLKNLGDKYYSICVFLCIKDVKPEELTHFQLGIDYTTYYFDLVNSEASVKTVLP